MQGCLVIQNKKPVTSWGNWDFSSAPQITLLVSFFLLMLLILKLLGQQKLQQGRRGLEEVGYREVPTVSVLSCPGSWLAPVGPESPERSEHVALCFLSGLFPSQFLTGLCLLSLLGNRILCKWAFTEGPRLLPTRRRSCRVPSAPARLHSHPPSSYEGAKPAAPPVFAYSQPGSQRLNRGCCSSSPRSQSPCGVWRKPASQINQAHQWQLLQRPSLQLSHGPEVRRGLALQADMTVTCVGRGRDGGELGFMLPGLPQTTDDTRPS